LNTNQPVYSISLCCAVLGKFQVSVKNRQFQTFIFIFTFTFWIFWIWGWQQWVWFVAVLKNKLLTSHWSVHHINLFIIQILPGNYVFGFSKMGLGQAEQHSSLFVNISKCLYSSLQLPDVSLAPPWPQ
jgi:hypothetical protein